MYPATHQPRGATGPTTRAPIPISYTSPIAFETLVRARIRQDAPELLDLFREDATDDLRGDATERGIKVRGLTRLEGLIKIHVDKKIWSHRSVWTAKTTWEVWMAIQARNREEFAKRVVSRRGGDG